MIGRAKVSKKEVKMNNRDTIRFLNSRINVHDLMKLLGSAVTMTEGFLECEVKKGFMSEQEKKRETQGAGQYLLALISELLREYGFDIQDVGKFDSEVDKVLQSILIVGLFNHAKMQKEEEKDEAMVLAVRKRHWVN